jgi:hypothetical protein
LIHKKKKVFCHDIVILQKDQSVMVLKNLIHRVGNVLYCAQVALPLPDRDPGKTR